jgi:predicted DNA repair protein MutK
MSGLLALLDDVALIARAAAASLDDIAGQAAKTGGKLAGVVIDDAAVTPRYVQGIAPARELPMIGRIALGSIRNKLVILLPAALLLSAFAPWGIAPLLLMGGLYLCFEGAEKVWHLIHPHAPDAHAPDPHDPHLEATRVAGAIKTDFILSAEIMAITLASLPPGQGLGWQAAVLAVVAVAITALVYGAVALIVKMDDLGLWLARTGRTGAARALGRGMVLAMPPALTLLSAVGTAAMIWVGGSIVVHALHEIGWHAPYDAIHHAAALAGASGGAAVEWLATAALDGVLGLALGGALVAVLAAGRRVLGRG